MKKFSDNLVFLRSRLGKKQYEVADDIGLKRSRYANYETGHSNPEVSVLLQLGDYFHVNIEDLLKVDLTNHLELINRGVKNASPTASPSASPTTKKEHKEDKNLPAVLNEPHPVFITVDSAGAENIVMVDVKAAAGYSNQFAVADPSYFKKLPSFQIPGPEFRNGTFRAFEVSGDSMYDTLYHGDWVICRLLHSFDEIKEGYVHVVITAAEVCVKRILNRSKARQKLVLKSDNEAYPPREMDITEVLEVWIVKSFLGFNLPNRSLDVKRAINGLQTQYLDISERLLLLEGKSKRK